jgi:hypothetical protein
MPEDAFETVRKVRNSFNAFMQGEASSEDYEQLMHPDV